MTTDRIKQIEKPKSWADLQTLQFFVDGGNVIIRDENGVARVIDFEQLGIMAERLGLALDFSK